MREYHSAPTGPPVFPVPAVQSAEELERRSALEWDAKLAERSKKTNQESQ
jgi:hypothetical protein